MPFKKVCLILMSLFVCVGLLQVGGTADAAGSATLRLGVNDELTEIEAISVDNTYYVPLRELTQALSLSLTGQKDGFQVKSQGRSILLLNDHERALLHDGSEVKLHTFLRGGKLMAPLKLTTYLGLQITYQPGDHLLRVRGVSAKLDDAAFVAQYKEKLKPKVIAVPPVSPATPPKTSGKPGMTVYLTFDDGPTAATSKLLAVLADYKVKATFFMIGPNMNTYPTQVKRLAEEGHSLALHGMTHRKEKFYASPSAALSEMDRDQAIVKKITGKTTTLIRPPYGSKPYFTTAFRDKVLGQGYQLWDWNVDSEDWRYKEDSNKIYTSVMNQVNKLKKSKTNPVILMHDQKATLKVLPRILESLQKEGYQFSVITQDTRPLNFWKDVR